MTSLIQVSRDGVVATLTLNRPEKRNALNVEMWQGIAAHLRDLADDDGLRCVVVQGAGGHFAAGADMAEFAARRATAADAESYGAVMLDALWTLRDHPLPTVARVEGLCLGGGLEIAAMCDLRLAADNAQFGIPIQRVGITMPYPELAALVDLIGRAPVLELLLGGEIHGADWALAKGLVTRVLPPEGLDAALGGLIDRLAAGSPLSHRNHKKFTRRCLEKAPLTAAELRESYAAVESDDYREGIAAFLGKRRPIFPGS